MPRGQRDGSLRQYSRLSRPEPLLFLPSISSIVLTRLSDTVPDPLLRKSGGAGNWNRNLRICSQELRPHRQSHVADTIINILCTWQLSYFSSRCGLRVPTQHFLQCTEHQDWFYSLLFRINKVENSISEPKTNCPECGLSSFLQARYAAVLQNKTLLLNSSLYTGNHFLGTLV
jgi:hypothetical protein